MVPGAGLVYWTLPAGNAKSRKNASKHDFITTDSCDFAPLADT